MQRSVTIDGGENEEKNAEYRGDWVEGSREVRDRDSDREDMSSCDDMSAESHRR